MELIPDMTVVIADDDHDDQFMIREAFKDIDKSIRVHSVDNGLELVNWLGQHPTPNFILMDLNMPLLNGLGALRVLKANQNFKNIPVYMLSTSRFEYDRQQATALGAQDFHTKPYNYPDLKSTIRNIYEHMLKIVH